MEFYRRILLLIILLLPGVVWGETPPLSVALYYGKQPPVNDLHAFDIVVIDPDSGLTPSEYGSGRSELFAYVSVGEADTARSYTKQMPDRWIIGKNPVWKSKIVDVSSEEWKQFFLDDVVEPLWQAGYRGFFLDTLDSYLIAAPTEAHPRMEAGLVSVVRAIRQRHPEARLILNRGFEIFDRVKDLVYAVAAESLFQNFNTVSGKYGAVDDKDRSWLTSRLNVIRETGVPVIAIDYVDPGNRPLMRETADKIRSLGFTPWVTDKDLAGLGIGSVEVMPRTVLGLYDGGEGAGGDLYFTNLQRYVVMPLNYLGYTVEMHDMREPLPGGVLRGRYAGAVIWPYSTSSGEKQGLKQWVLNCVEQGLPLVFLERFGMNLDNDLTSSLGLGMESYTRLEPPAKVTAKDDMVGFEQQPLPRIDAYLPIRANKGRVLLQLSTANGVTSDAVVITPWGGYVSGPYVVTQLMESQAAWVIDPFRFFGEALKLPLMPVPDTTTENGVRLLLSHVDGDGFTSQAEWPGGKLAAEELRSKILERYRIPTTISFITSILAPDGLYPQKSAQYEEIAHGILALPWIEGASHSFSHPFRWKPDQEDTGLEAEIWHTLNVPGYKFNLESEISGSTKYINERLMPTGKKVRIFQWTGNCLPSQDAVRLTYESGLLNINGGDTIITNSNRTLTAVAPLGISRGKWFQVFAPNQNENVYTELWIRNYYGYRRIMETFSLTESPRRLKPVNIYYHFYSASKEASLTALRQVYDWAMGQRLFGIFTSEYLEKALDFNRTVIARSGDEWLVRNGGSLRQLRIPSRAGFPLLDDDSNLAGYSDLGDSRYLHMGTGGEARVRLTATPSAGVSVESAAARLTDFSRNGKNMRFSLSGYTPFTVKLTGTNGCTIHADNATPYSVKGDTTVTLTEGSHALAITCK
ncbi:hypothetical protein GeomeDRAFT_0501 [Geobacter metallireducens RCH3]|uniref:Glycoside-hydrolase family GH114 TIM-barrel domain-containing protein n=1 Tax=Geobacter metallireducens (strain ATCC 53774 / DSM 7210 / GS-15) TaxID=269799 RepID=Q39U83_GEOMG|nr:protein of unknown function, DUF297-containing [Geobacter metallireducens GS-15]EHP88620.1 hypothetical protein GeomeDRAFT_0501 [Geobacter metallireducens RCH3]